MNSIGDATLWRMARSTALAKSLSSECLRMYAWRASRAGSVAVEAPSHGEKSASSWASMPAGEPSESSSAASSSSGMSTGSAVSVVDGDEAAENLSALAPTQRGRSGGEGAGDLARADALLRAAGRGRGRGCPTKEGEARGVASCTAGGGRVASRRP